MRGAGCGKVALLRQRRFFYGDYAQAELKERQSVHLPAKGSCTTYYVKLGQAPYPSLTAFISNKKSRLHNRLFF